jgi:hypothetical protein
MTTIVANLECMAADQRVTCGGPMCHTVKIHRIRGNLYGLAGDVMIGLHVLNWLNNAKRDPEVLYKLIPPDHRDLVDILELSKTGLALWNGWGVRMPILDHSYAIGSGAMPALQSYRDHRDVEKAAKASGGLDEGSGTFAGIPQVEWLKPKK